MSRTLNAQSFGSVAEMAVAGGGYISSGYPELGQLSQALIENLVGTTSIGGRQVHCLPYGTLGRSAVTGVLLPFVTGGRKVVVAGNIFGGIWAFLKFLAPMLGGKTVFTDFNDLEGLEKTLRGNSDASAIFFEPISNPLLRVADVAAVVKLTRANCPEALVIADDTLTAGLRNRENKLFTRWLLETCEVDIVVAALTKYICGFNDERGGSVIMLERELPPWMDIPLPFITQLHQGLEFIRKLTGAIPHPEAAKLLLKRIGWVEDRLQKHSENALQFARGLGEDIAIYPGLPSHPDYACIRGMDLDSCGGIVSFRTGGDFQQAGDIVDQMAAKDVGWISNSFGDQTTFIEPIYAAVGEGLRAILCSLGIPEDLVRVSLGHDPTPLQAHSAGEKTRRLLGR